MLRETGYLGLKDLLTGRVIRGTVKLVFDLEGYCDPSYFATDTADMRRKHLWFRGRWYRLSFDAQGNLVSILFNNNKLAKNIELLGAEGTTISLTVKL